MKKYTITALLANKSGVLTRLSGLFARRGFNIHSISACATEDEHFSRVTTSRRSRSRTRTPPSSANFC